MSKKQEPLLSKITCLGTALSLNEDNYYTGDNLYVIPPSSHGERPQWTAGFADGTFTSLRGYGLTIEEAETNLITKFKEYKAATEKSVADIEALLEKKDKVETLYFGGITFEKQKGLTEEGNESFISLFANFYLERGTHAVDGSDLWRVVPMNLEVAPKGAWFPSIRQALAAANTHAREHLVTTEERLESATQIHNSARSWANDLLKLLNA